MSKTSPGLIKEVCYLNKFFSPMEEAFFKVTWSTLLKLGKNENIKYIAFYNTSIYTFLYVLYFKLIHQEKNIIMFVHEPYKLNMSEYYKPWVAAKNHLIFVINGICGRLCDRVIYLSEYGYKMGQRNVFLRNKTSSTVTLKLEILKFSKVSKKRQFLIYGQINQTKTLDWLEELLKVLPEEVVFKVKVLTANALPYRQEEIFRKYKNFIELDLRSELSDACISQNIRESIGTIHFHNGVTQSGAVVESFRHNVPVVCRNIPGMQQHVHVECGEIVDELCYQTLRRIAEKFQMESDEYELYIDQYFKDTFTLDLNADQLEKYYMALTK